MTKDSAWPSGPPATGYVAYVAALLFLLAFARFFLLPPEGPRNLPVALLGVAPHALLFLVVAAIAAPAWARAAGYGWLVIDMATDVMALNGVPTQTFLALRYGGHLSAALWIGAASWRAGGWVRVVGLLLALDLALYSFVAPFASFVVLFPSLLLLPLWLVLIGRLILSAHPPFSPTAARTKGV